MKVLVVNAGSSSLKYQFIDMETELVLTKGLCENIGTKGNITHKTSDGKKLEKDYPMPTHKEAIALVLSLLTDKEYGVISDVSEIDAVGHRIAHGGEKLRKSTLIDDEVLNYLEGIVPINPLHGPPAISGMRACIALMPTTPQVGVFDTSFYGDIPEKKRLISVITDTILNKLMEFFKLQIENGKIKEVNPNVLAVMCFSIIFQSVILWKIYNDGADFDTDQYGDDVLDILFNGIKCD